MLKGQPVLEIKNVTKTFNTSDNKILTACNDISLEFEEGKILGIVPKSYIPNYSEFYEKRWFTAAAMLTDELVALPFQENIPFGTNLIFAAGDYKFGIEICEDLWVTIPPSSYLSLLGANILSIELALLNKSFPIPNLLSSPSIITISLSFHIFLIN